MLEVDAAVSAKTASKDVKCNVLHINIGVLATVERAVHLCWKARSRFSNQRSWNAIDLNGIASSSSYGSSGAICIGNPQRTNLSEDRDSIGRCKLVASGSNSKAGA